MNGSCANVWKLWGMALASEGRDHDGGRGRGSSCSHGPQPDTPGKLAAHAYSYEHLEIASYELLARVAGFAGDTDTVAVAERILADEQRMADRLEGTLRLTRRDHHLRRCGQTISARRSRHTSSTRTRSRSNRPACFGVPSTSRGSPGWAHTVAPQGERCPTSGSWSDGWMRSAATPSAPQGRGDADRCVQLGDVLQSPSRHGG